MNATVTPAMNSLEPAISIGMGTAKDYVFVHWRPTVAELERIVAEYKAALDQREEGDVQCGKEFGATSPTAYASAANAQKN